MHLCERGRRVAVLAIDPSSTITGGSILGDRTRMKRLGAHPGAFIRPSPAGGTLGGVARRTREVATLCQAAGYGVILIETVGVGQSETLVADLVDCVVALAVAGTGDELQGVKRGLLERVDVVAVNKADGENVVRAKQAALELAAALRVLHGPEAGVPVLTCSGATGEGVEAVWAAVEQRLETLRASGRLDARRQDQAVAWLETMLDERLRALLENSPAAIRVLAEAREGVRSGRISAEGGAGAVIEALVAELGRKET
jgi:LAO/AO transport system kinase